MKRLLCFLFLLPLAFCFPQTKIFYQNRFTADDANWKREGNAYWSRTARVPNLTGSLAVSRNNAEEAGNVTRWLSPAIPVQKRAVKVSFFAADNYLVQQDFSYAAHVIVRDCDPAGKTGDVLKTVYTEWDNSVKSPWMWGKRTIDNLIWRYYEILIPAGHDHIQIEFGFRGELVRGSCYLTDITVAETAETAPLPSAKQTQSHLLELSNPAVGGLFYEQDPLRFDASIRGKIPENAELKVTVTDFEYNNIGIFKFPMTDAAPLADKSFYASDAAKKRNLTPGNHKVKRFVLWEKAQIPTGILYRIKAELISKEKVLAEDTSLFGVVPMPKQILPKEKQNSYFWTRGLPVKYYDGASSAGTSLQAQDMTRKTGSFRSCELSESYNWRQLQPVYPGPVIIRKKLPGYPLQTYMPNIEQVHIARFIPEGAQKPTKNPILYAGKKGMELIDYDVNAYADFILEYIRQNRQAIDWVVPSGLERRLNDRVIALQKKVYEECKKRFPEIKVGFCINFVTVADFDKYELWKYADFLNLHLYGATAGFPFNESVIPYKNYYRTKFKRSAPPFTMTEGALRMPPGHINYAAGTMRGIWSLMEQNFQGIYYYHQGNLFPLKNPDTTDFRTSDPGSSVYDNYRYHQLVDRPIMAPELVMERGYESRRWDNKTSLGGGVSILPTVSTLVYCNLIQDFDRAKLRFSRMLPSAKIYCFDRENTVCGIDPREGSPGNPIIVNTTVPFKLRDIFGRIAYMKPVNGKAIIQTGKYPCTLIFDSVVKNLSFKEMKSSGLTPLSGMPGGKLNFDLKLDSIKEPKGILYISGTEHFFDIRKPITLPKLKSREYPAIIALESNQENYAILFGTLKVENPVLCKLSPIAGREPGMEVVIQNRSDKTISGTVSFFNDLLSIAPVPYEMREKFRIEPGAKGTVQFIFNPMMAKSNFNEFADVTVTLDNGETIELRERLHFRKAVRLNKPPVIDGDLSDWRLESINPVLMERVRMTDPDEPAPDSMMSPGKFYIAWHGTTLYMAAIVKDKTPVTRHNDIWLWIDDNLLFGIYPWRHWNGEKFHPGFYRGHTGLHKNGTAGNYREPDIPAGGSVDTKRIKTVIRRKNGTLIYEMAFPEGTLHPFTPAVGNGLRISLTCFDADGSIKHDYKGPLYYFGGANVNFHMDVNQWFEFICTE